MKIAVSSLGRDLDATIAPLFSSCFRLVATRNCLLVNEVLVSLFQ